MSNNSKEQQPSTATKIKKALSGLLVGGLFGYALQRSKVYLPIVIQQQMTFTNQTMFKMFMTATLTSSLTVSLLDSSKMISLEYLPVMWSRNLIGGLIMGAGIYMTGACPGTVLAQVGSGIHSAYYTLAGGLLGVALFALSNNLVQKLFPTQSNKKQTIQQVFSMPLIKGAIPFALFAASALYGLEKLAPWQVDSQVASSVATFSLSNLVWSPYTAGLLIGLLQAPSYLLSGSGLGTSSAYCTVSDKVCNAFSCSLDYFSRFRSGIRSIYGPMLNVGIILGAYYSSTTAPALASQKILSHSPLYHILGGTILLFGARLANGCTSGHLTGASKLEIGSFITIAALFSGGIGAALLSK